MERSLAQSDLLLTGMWIKTEAGGVNMMALGSCQVTNELLAVIPIQS